MADIKNFGIVGVGSDVQFGKGGGTFKWDTDGFISTTNGTTLADLDAATMNFTGLSGTGAVTVTDILDEDNMASDSATALATQQSIKAYVDSQVGATTLTGTGDSGAFTVDLDSDTFGVLGGTNLTSTGSGSNVTVALDADISLTSVTATGNVDASNFNATGDVNAVNGNFTGTVQFGTGSGGSITGADSITAGNITATGNLIVGTYAVTDIIDDDTMATATDKTLSTSESIKAYVDATATAADLDIAGDSGTGSVDLDSQVFTIAGGIGLSSTTTNQTTEVRLNNTAVTAGNYGDATNIPQFTVDQQGRITAAANVAIQTAWTLAGDSGSEVVNGGDTATIAGGTNITTAASATDTLTVNLDDDISLTSVTATGNVDAGNVNLTGDLSAVNGVFSGSVQFGSGSGGSLSGLASIEADNVSATGNLIVGGYAITDILDEDNMVSDSDKAVPTQQSVKAYVDAVATSADLDFQGDSGTGAVDLDSQTLDIAGGLNLTSTALGQTLTVDMDTTLTGMTAATFSGSVQAGSLTDGTMSISSGTITGGVGATFSGTVDANTVEFDNLSGTGTVSVTNIIDDDTMGTASATTLATSESTKAYVDTVAAGVVSDGNINIEGDSGTGSVNFATQTLDVAGGLNLTSTASGQEISVAMDTTLTGMTAATFSGTVQAGTLTDGTASINGGAITGATDITATGTITGNGLSDGVATISNGSLTGGVEAIFSKTVTAGNLDASGGLVTFNQLSDGTVTIDAILDEDNMVSDSATAVPTQQSTKAYVDSQIALQGASMNLQGDTGTGSIVFATETLDIAGTANEIETEFDNGTNTMTIGLPDDVTITGNLSVGGSLNSDDITAENISVNGDVTVFGDTVMEGNLTVQGNTTIVNSNTITTGDNIITLNADLPGNVVPVANMGLEMNRGSEANVTFLWVEATDTFTFSNENDVLQDVKAREFEAADFVGANATLTGDVSFGTLTDSGESITVTKFVDEADGLANNDDDTSIPTTAAVIDYVDTNAGDGNLIRNGAIGTGSQTVTIGTVPSNANRIYYLLKVVVKVTVAYSGNSVDHIIVNEDGGLGTQIVTNADADALNTGTYVIEGDGATTLENGETILLGFRDSGNNLVAPTAGAMSVSVFYGWEDAPA